MNQERHLICAVLIMMNPRMLYHHVIFVTEIYVNCIKVSPFMTDFCYSPSVLDDIRVAPSSITRLMLATLFTKLSVYSRIFLVAKSKEFGFGRI